MVSIDFVKKFIEKMDSVGLIFSLYDTRQKCALLLLTEYICLAMLGKSAFIGFTGGKD